MGRGLVRRNLWRSSNLQQYEHLDGSEGKKFRKVAEAYRDTDFTSTRCRKGVSPALVFPRSLEYGKFMDVACTELFENLTTVIPPLASGVFRTPHRGVLSVVMLTPARPGS